MLPFSDSLFWILSAIFIVTNILFRVIFLTRNIKLVNNIMIPFNLVIIYLSMNKQWILFCAVLILCLLIYYSGKYIKLNSRLHRSKYFLLFFILFTLFFLFYFKYSIFQNFINCYVLKSIVENACNNKNTKVLFLIGVSYFSFKFIHFIVDSYKNKISNYDLAAFINYIFFFPSFFSGPINRYQSFTNCIGKEPNWKEDIAVGSKRIINGLFRKIVVGDSIYCYSISSVNIENMIWYQTMFAVYAYMFFIYFNFSGYTEMAIGIGRMAGIELPENFNNPFIKRNLQQFWASWHMSLTGWLTDYIYWPLTKRIRSFTFFKKRPVTLSCISILVTFLVCGLWHGDGMNFVVWGLYHGVGLSILNIYGLVIKTYASIKVKQIIRKSKIYYFISLFITFQFVAFGFLIFSCDMQKVNMILRSLF